MNVGIYNLMGSKDSNLEETLGKYAEVFQGDLETIKGFKVKLHVDPNAKPKFCKARTVPFEFGN